MQMFDLTEQEIHETWFKPRIAGYAKDMGVKVKVSDWNDEGIVTIELAE
jgi:alpha-glucosidase (family GH31 glycosyl hydrolase)